MDHPARWDKVSELYSAALGLAISERRAFLMVNCEGNDDICEEVERMLSVSHPVDFLESRGELRTAWESDVPAKLVPQGEVLAGRFKVVRFIGRGGMGEVYEALHTALNERLALKILRAEIAHDKETIIPVKQESQLSRRIPRPHR